MSFDKQYLEEALDLLGAYLESLGPTPVELVAAARWCRTQDPSEGFLMVLRQALSALGVDDGDELARL